MHNYVFQPTNTALDFDMKLLVLAGTATLSGCVALGVQVEEPEVLDVSEVKLLDQFRASTSTIGPPGRYSKEEVRAMWGDPDEIIKDESSERWRYDDGFSWGGIAAILIIIPVPLLVPIGLDTTELTFSGESLVKVTNDDTTFHGFECGWGINRPTGEPECGFR